MGTRLGLLPTDRHWSREREMGQPEDTPLSAADRSSRQQRRGISSWELVEDCGIQMKGNELGDFAEYVNYKNTELNLIDSFEKS